jgi:hypothetical protein
MMSGGTNGAEGIPPFTAAREVNRRNARTGRKKSRCPRITAHMRVTVVEQGIAVDDPLTDLFDVILRVHTIHVLEVDKTGTLMVELLPKIRSHQMRDQRFEPLPALGMSNPCVVQEEVRVVEECEGHVQCWRYKA